MDNAKLVNACKAVIAEWRNDSTDGEYFAESPLGDLRKILDETDLFLEHTMQTTGKRHDTIIRIQTNLNLPLKTREKIEQIAYDNRISMTEVVVSAIDYYTRDSKNED